MNKLWCGALLAFIFACAPARQPDYTYTSTDTDAGTDGGTACPGACAEHSARCQGNAVEVCAVIGDACPAWSQPFACGSNQFCIDGACSSSCQTQCAIGEKRCVGNDVQECASLNGCLVWGTGSTCGSGQTCENGACHGSCTDACTAGEMHCSGANVQVCETAASGCLNWSAARACGTGQSCDALQDRCVSTTTTTPIGAACVTDSQCQSGTTPACATATNGWPDGYCYSTCSTATDCGSTGVCVSGFFSSGSFCMGTCSTDRDCRAAYRCEPHSGGNFCFPKCTSNTDCNTGETCNTSTGVCDTTAAGYPATFPSPPQVQNYGGPVLGSMKIVPVFFSNDTSTVTTPMKDFFSRIGNSTFWAAASEYGVGTATAGTPVTLAEQAPTSVTDTAMSGSPLWVWLQAKIDAHQLPTPDANTLYAVSYPTGTTITVQNEVSCQTFGGYHLSMRLSNGSSVAYAVLPRCSPTSGFSQLSYLTSAASHELIEAATDPYPFTNPAYAALEAAHYYWNDILSGGEVGDVCTSWADSYHQFPDLPYTVQRYWSNAAAAAGHDPCVPSLGDVYFNAVAVQSDTFTYPVGSQSVQVTGVRTGLNVPKTIPIQLYSSGPTSGPWTVAVAEINGSGHLGFSISSSSGQNGDRLNLTITPHLAGTNNMVPFQVVSTLGSTRHISYGLVYEQ
jgi:hypothetical protein